MTPEAKRRAAQAKARRREELVIPEIGAGISDLCQGAVTKYAPSGPIAESEWIERVAQHRLIGRGFLPYFQLSEEPSQECLDALAVWQPLPLRHLLSLDARPRLRLVDVRRSVSSQRTQFERLDTVLGVLEDTATAVDMLASDDYVRSLAATHSAIGDVIRHRTTGAWPTERDLTREDVTSDKAQTLEHVEHILTYLRSDVGRLRNRAESSLTRARSELDGITGAKQWSADQSLRFSRRLVTLVDMLRFAYPDGRWTWRRFARLIRASSTDWVTPPCPELATRETADMVPLLKMRDRRERGRREKLKLTVENIYPWLGVGNNFRLRP